MIYYLVYAKSAIFFGTMSYKNCALKRQSLYMGKRAVSARSRTFRLKKYSADGES
jgi:hypothetical protein